MLTSNLVRAAPVALCETVLRDGKARAVVVNSGCANACTGADGLEDARATAREAAKVLGVGETEVLVASTGVIGRRLDMDRLLPAVREAAGRARDGASDEIAPAIMTTDTRPKKAGAAFADGGGEFVVAGAAKGAGMIAPRLARPHATMLAFLVTDYPVAPPALALALERACVETFNRTTIDGDTSTNDTVLVFSAGGVDGTDAPCEGFQDALTAVCNALARAMAADGEGAKHFVIVEVRGAHTDEEAALAARAVAESPLVKTAVCGNDPNWGRIAAACGRSGAVFDPVRLAVNVCEVEVCRGGGAVEFDAGELRERMSEGEVLLSVDLGAGTGEARFYTCDLTRGYIEVNAEYHT